MLPRGALKIQIAFWALRPTSTENIFTLKVLKLMPRGALKIQIAFWALRPTSTKNLGETPRRLNEKKKGKGIRADRPLKEHLEVKGGQILKHALFLCFWSSKNICRLPPTASHTAKIAQFSKGMGGR